jgi:F0F1-type ATP synthase assembly protein I
MAEDSPARGDSRPRSDEPAERQPSGADVGWGITGTMLSGIIVWGGVGWLLDRWLETRFFTLVGTLLGLTVAIYLVVVKYGAVDPPAGARRPGSTRGGHRSRPRTTDQTQKGQR